MERGTQRRAEWRTTAMCHTKTKHDASASLVEDLLFSTLVVTLLSTITTSTTTKIFFFFHALNLKCVVQSA